jgi:hypothetical protein
MFGLDDIVGLIQAVSSLASLAKTVQSFTQPTPSATGGPMPLPSPGGTDMSSQARAALPSQKADTAAKLGGGISPEFLANLIGEQVGSPAAGLDILGDIRKGMNVQAP